MAERERIHPSPNDSHEPRPIHDSNPNLGATTPDMHGQAFASGTYIVQIPKDQIYWVPPSQNERLAEINRNRIAPKKKWPRWCRCLSCVVITIVSSLIMLGIAAGISEVSMRPKNPTFGVEHFLVKNSSAKGDKLEYDIRLSGENPNSHTGITYKEGGVASLSFKNDKIGSGDYPSLYQGRKDTESISLVLEGSSSGLPKTKANVSFVLDISVPARMRFGFFRNRNMDVEITCSFEIDKLSNVGSRVLSQSCQTSRQLH